MFGFGWGEMMVIGIVALIAIGPKELPAVLRTIGQAMGKVRRMASEFQGQFNEALREAELTDLKKQTEEFTSDMTNFDPLADTQKEMEQAFNTDPQAGTTSAAPTTAVEAPTPLPQIDVPMPDFPPPLTEKDFAAPPAQEASKEAAQDAPPKAPKKPRKQAKA